MRVDAPSLQRFYAGPLGQAAQRMIERRLDALWARAEGRDMLGVGYAGPHLARFRESARRAVAFMPAAQGAETWPAEGAGLAVLGDETRLPFMDAMFDRVIVAHALEEAENIAPLLREIWRVTAPEGRVVVIVANRVGLWARADSTPFGHGRPFSRRQLAALLTDAMFQPTATARALYAPPVKWAARFALPIEHAGGVLWPAFGGLILMEAAKRLYAEPAAPARKKAAQRALRPANALPRTRP
ncbi:MAG: class I SAM-dependent methyltransferase [Hyphomonadaceae bacterium]